MCCSNITFLHASFVLSKKGLVIFCCYFKRVIWPKNWFNFDWHFCDCYTLGNWTTKGVVFVPLNFDFFSNNSNTMNIEHHYKLIYATACNIVMSNITKGRMKHGRRLHTFFQRGGGKILLNFLKTFNNFINKYFFEHL